MNIYRCQHRGTSGYGCRVKPNSWLFVPDLGECDNRIHRNIPLDSLVFDNILELQYELSRDQGNRLARYIRSFLDLFLPISQPVTTAGLLLIPER